MMLESSEKLQKWLADMALLIDQDKEPTVDYYNNFMDEPELALRLAELLNLIKEKDVDEKRSYYSACVFALEICVAQLQVSGEGGNKKAHRMLDLLMSQLADYISTNEHSLSFWLPVLNAFYEVHVELSSELKAAYLDLANDEDVLTPEEEFSHLNSMRDLIEELSDLSVLT